MMQSIEVYNMTLKEQETYESLSEKTEMQIKDAYEKIAHYKSELDSSLIEVLRYIWLLGSNGRRAASSTAVGQH